MVAGPRRCRKAGCLLTSIGRTCSCAMATNLDVDLGALDELVALGGYRSKREAVDAAVKEAIAYRKQLRSLQFLATVDFAPAIGDGAPADTKA